MPKQLDEAPRELTIKITKDAEGNLVTNIQLKGNISNPDGTNDYDKGPHEVTATVPWVGSQTMTQFKAACIVALEAKGEV